MSEKPEQTKIPAKKSTKKSAKKAAKKPGVEPKDVGTKIAPETPNTAVETNVASEVKSPAAPKDAGPKPSAETPKPDAASKPAEVPPPAVAKPTVTSSPVSAPIPAEVQVPASPAPQPTAVPKPTEAAPAPTSKAGGTGFENIKRKVTAASKTAALKIKSGSKVAGAKIKAGSKKTAAKMKDLGSRAANTIKKMDKPAKTLVLVLLIAVVVEIPLFLSIGANLKTANGVPVLNRVPVLNGVTPTPGILTIDEGTNLQFEVNPSDPDGDVLSYTWTLDGASVGGNRSSYAFETNYFTGGLIYNITVIVSDGTAQVTRSWAINVTNKIVRLGDCRLDDVLYSAGDKVFFTVEDISGDVNLWVCDGSNTGAHMILGGDAHPNYFSALGDTIYFVASDGSGSEIFKSDGTYAGTTQVTNSLSAARYYNLYSWRGRVFFCGYNESVPTYGEELWVTDGTAAGTKMVNDTNPGVGDGSPWGFASAGNYLYFRSLDSLWRTDGTPGGTIPLHAFTSYSGDTEYWAALGTTLLFAATDGTGAGNELWKSDGTPSGTVLVKDIQTGISGSDPVYLTVLGDKVYFRANNGTLGEELWKSDGTEAGTVLVKDINPTPTIGSDLCYITRLGCILLFQANDGTHNSELWMSDGTTSGTRLVKDINPTGSSSPDADSPYYRFGISAGRAVFEADDGIHGTMLWSSDGTETGTFLVEHTQEGISDFSPSDYLTVGNAVFFMGYDDDLRDGIYIY